VEKSPVSDSDAPMTMGALVVPAGVDPLLLLPLLLQPAARAAATTAAAPRDKNRAWWDLIPGPPSD
jgi:hypothetical protein